MDALNNGQSRLVEGRSDLVLGVQSSDCVVFTVVRVPTGFVPGSRFRPDSLHTPGLAPIRGVQRAFTSRLPRIPPEPQADR